MYKNTFSRTERLKSINFSMCENLTEISDSCFYGCVSLEDVILPPNLEQIPKHCFFGCLNLKCITLTSKIKRINESSFESSGLTELCFDGCSIESFGMRCFYSTKMERFELPNSVKHIATQALSHCEYLDEFIINPESLLESIDKEIISNSNKIKSVYIGPKVNAIADGAFSQAYSLIEFRTSPNNLLYYGEGPFLYCQGTKIVAFAPGYNQSEINERVTEIMNSAFFMCTKLLYIIFDPKSRLRAIGSSTFFGCSQITQISFPDELDSIGSEAFKGCENLNSVLFGSKLKSIGVSAFEGCFRLGSVTLPAKTEHVHEKAFKNCSGLRSVWLPNSLVKLEAESFADCKNLALVEVCVESQSEAFSSSAFSGHHRDATAIVSMF